MKHSTRSGAPRLALLCILIACSIAGPADAHDVALTRVAIYVSDGHCRAELSYDVDADILGVQPGHLTPPDFQRLRDLPPNDRQKRESDLREMLQRRLRIRFDGQAAPFQIDFPECSRELTESGSPSAGHRCVLLDAAIPPVAKRFDFWASKSFGRVVLLVRIADGPQQQQLLDFAERSRPFNLKSSDGGAQVGEARDGDAQSAGVVWKWLKLGYEHILPRGLDHILFVLGLFLLANRLSPLFWQVTAFTVAHCTSLALSTYGIISVSPRIVEPMIALSIAYVAIENISTAKMHSWRVAIVFLFGLLHSLGFAGVLHELGLPRDQFVTALLCFNLGVEAGQATVILAAFALVGWAWRKPWYRRRIVIPASIAIACVGLFWAAQRTQWFG